MEQGESEPPFSPEAAHAERLDVPCGSAGTFAEGDAARTGDLSVLPSKEPERRIEIGIRLDLVAEALKAPFVGRCDVAKWSAKASLSAS